MPLFTSAGSLSTADFCRLRVRVLDDSNFVLEGDSPAEPTGDTERNERHDLESEDEAPARRVKGAVPIPAGIQPFSAPSEASPSLRARIELPIVVPV